MSVEMDAFTKALSQTTTSASQLDDPVHPHIFLADGTQIIIQQFNLNDDQAQIIVDHTPCQSWKWANTLYKTEWLNYHFSAFSTFKIELDIFIINAHLSIQNE